MKKQKRYVKEKEQTTHKKAHKEAKVKDYTIEISQMRSDIKTFIEKFKSDVAKKRKEFAQKLQ